MPTRDEVFLKHLGRYRLSLERIAVDHFYGPTMVKPAIERLEKDGRLAVRKTGDARTATKGFPYFQLTVAEARRLGVPENRAKPLQSEALHKNLAVLWFCMMSPPPGRTRIEPKDYPVDVLGPPPTAKEPICAEKGSGCLRLIVPGSTVGFDHAFRNIQKEIAMMLGHALSKRALDSGWFRFVLLVEKKSRQELALDSIADFKKSAAVYKRVHIDAQLAPGPSTLVNEFLEAGEA